MKAPSISKDAVIDFFLHHAEKIGAAVLGIMALLLVWGGVSALRSQTVTADRRPEALTATAARTLQHIEAEKKPPAEVATKTASLQKTIEPWRAPQVAAAQPTAFLDRPLFEEMGRRTKPEVFPIEDLRASAGLAVLAVQPRQDEGFGRNVNRDLPPKPKPKPGKGKREVEPEGFGGFGGEMQPALPGDGTVAMPPGRIVPYVVVTGLIPVAKQYGDYQQRFQSASLRDEKRDSPLWSDYLVERSVVVPGGVEKWERIDLKAVAKRARDEWAGIHGEPLPPEFLLAAEQHPGSGGIGYCAPLPQLAMEGWGPESLHPWFQQELRRLLAEREAETRQAQERVDTGSPTGEETTPGFESPLAEPQDPLEPHLAATVDASGKPLNPLEYRLFRFVDTSVQPGRQYRYRVRLSVWNPNYNVPAQHLAEATLAKDVKIPSQPSNVTELVTIPESTVLLVRSLPREVTKRFKAGMAEVLVLGVDDRTGNYSLRGLTTDLGGLANVDTRLNKVSEQRTRGEEITTNAVLIDMMGRQDDRADMRTNKPTPPPEPLEMLFLREDGSMAHVTAAESAERVNRYLSTLPADPSKGTDSKDTGEPEPLGDTPFSFPGLAPRGR